MIVGPGDEKVTAALGHGHRRASRIDREQTINAVKAAFVQGRLTAEEFDARIGQALTARTHAVLAILTADIPVELTEVSPPRRVSNAVRWAASGVVTPAVLAAAFALTSLPGGGRYGAAAFVVAFGYFVFWLSAGADMLWQWHCSSLPKARMCVRCGHTAASHHVRTSCAVRVGSLNVWRHCPCPGYVPPGQSAEPADLDNLAIIG